MVPLLSTSVCIYKCCHGVFPYRVKAAELFSLTCLLPDSSFKSIDLHINESNMRSINFNKNEERLIGLESLVGICEVCPTLDRI